MADIVTNVLDLDSQHHDLIINSKGDVDFRLVAPFPDGLGNIEVLSHKLEIATDHIPEKQT